MILLTANFLYKHQIKQITWSVFQCIQLKMMKVQSDLDSNTMLHKCVKSIHQSLNHFLYLLLCMIFPLLLWYAVSNSWWHLTCIQFVFKVELCWLSLYGFFITVSGTGNITYLRGAFTEPVNITFLTSPLQPECGTKKTANHVFLKCPIHWPTHGLHCPDGSAWWGNWMAAQALIEDLAQPSSVLKEVAEAMKKTFWIFVSTLFPTRKNFISSSLTIATVTSWQGGQTTVHGPHAAHKSM